MKPLQVIQNLIKLLTATEFNIIPNNNVTSYVKFNIITNNKIWYNNVTSKKKFGIITDKVAWHIINSQFIN